MMDGTQAHPRRVTLSYDGDEYRYDVSWLPHMRRYGVRAIDEGWNAWVHPADVPFPTARNIAIEAAERGVS